MPALREKPGKGHFQDPVFIGYRDALRHAGGLEILALLDGGAGIYQMPQPAGDPFRPKRSIRRENFVIVGIALDVCCVHRIQRITQTGYIVKNAPYSAGNQFSIQKSCASCFLEILGLSILGYGAKTGYVGTVDFGNLCRRIDHDDAAATALVAP